MVPEIQYRDLDEGILLEKHLFLIAVRIIIKHLEEIKESYDCSEELQRPG